MQTVKRLKGVIQGSVLKGDARSLDYGSHELLPKKTHALYTSLCCKPREDSVKNIEETRKFASWCVFFGGFVGPRLEGLEFR